MNIVKIMDKIFGNWYIIGVSAIIAFAAAILDQFIYTDWLYGLGVKSALIFAVCATYIVLRTIVNSIIDYF